MTSAFSHLCAGADSYMHGCSAALSLLVFSSRPSLSLCAMTRHRGGAYPTQATCHPEAFAFNVTYFCSVASYVLDGICFSVSSSNGSCRVSLHVHVGVGTLSMSEEAYKLRPFLLEVPAPHIDISLHKVACIPGAVASLGIGLPSTVSLPKQGGRAVGGWRVMGLENVALCCPRAISTFPPFGCFCRSEVALFKLHREDRR